jgi:DNA-directed RNA polymerase alpha subunit
MQPISNHILTENIANLQLSSGFKECLLLNNFTSLNQLLLLTTQELMEYPGMNYHFLQEYIQLLEMHQLAQLLKD